LASYEKEADFPVRSTLKHQPYLCKKISAYLTRPSVFARIDFIDDIKNDRDIIDSCGFGVYLLEGRAATAWAAASASVEKEIAACGASTWAAARASAHSLSCVPPLTSRTLANASPAALSASAKH
jgi:hypothetical protein